MLKIKDKLLAAGILVVFIISFILRYKILFNNFVLDDFILVVNNSFIKDFLNIFEVLNPKNLFSVLPIRCGARPFTVFSLIVDYHFFGINPFGYHFINLLLHSINSCLLFLFCYQLKIKNKLFPFAAALFFSLHPVQTEVVNTISFRADLLLTLFSLISFNLFALFKVESLLKYNKLLYVMIFISVFLAFLSKENAVVLPVIFFIYIFFFYNKNNLLKFSFITFIFVICLFFFFWIERFPVPLYFSIYHSLPLNTIPLSSMINYIYTVLTALFYNVWHVLYPVNLSVDYTLIFSKYIVSFTFIFIISIAVIFFCIKDKYIKFTVLALTIAYLPISNLVPLVNTVADRYMYYPMIFVAVLFGLLIVKLEKYINPKLLTVFVIILFSINAAISYERGTVYNNQYSLYSDAILKNPNHTRSLYNMAIAYYDNKEYEKSIEMLNRLSDIDPNYKREFVWFIMGNNYEALNDKDLSKKYYMKALLLSPKNQDFLDKFISMFSSVDNSLYYLLNNTKSLDEETILSVQQYQKSKNTVEVK
ncbi:MAG: tetratricopeptide repeat protein [Endomicrobiaceae bacterium]|nr:tetratricopeptide repeat protein [Endomicrobiaceae bacterium]